MLSVSLNKTFPIRQQHAINKCEDTGSVVVTNSTHMHIHGLFKE